MSTGHPTHGAASRLVDELRAGAEQGFWRRLDSAFAGFMLDLDPAAPAVVVMAAALLVHMEGQGHSCLDIDDVQTEPDGLATATPRAAPQWRRVMQGLPTAPDAWLEMLRRSPLVWVDAAATGGRLNDLNQPLVLRGRRLYLRRHWCHEQRVAEQVQARCRNRGAPIDMVTARRCMERLFPAPQASASAAGPQGLSGSQISQPIDRPIGGPTSGPTDGPIDWQRVACAVALRAGLTIITGGPGTGKTHTAARLLVLLLALNPASQRLRVALCAPTGKAAARLKQAMSSALLTLQDDLAAGASMADLQAAIGNTGTLHSLLGARPDTRQFRFSASQPLPLDVLIVDEASMIPLEMMAVLLDALPAQARLILLGDRHQLASVETGAVFGDLCGGAAHGATSAETSSFIEAVSGQALPASAMVGRVSALARQTVTLCTSHRFGGPIERLARAVNDGDAATASALLQTPDDDSLAWLQMRRAAEVVSFALQGRSGAPGGYLDYARVLRRRPDDSQVAAFETWVVELLTSFDRFRLLCAVREGDWGVMALNRGIERGVVAAGGLTRHGDWYEGRPVMVTRNDPATGLFNGDIGIALRPPGVGGPQDAAAPSRGLRVYFVNATTLRSVATSRLADVETAFALTVHKSQGSEFEHCVLVLPAEPSPVLTRELVYTGITRSRAAFTLVTGRDAGFMEALDRRVRRSSGLPELLADGGLAGGAFG